MSEQQDHKQEGTKEIQREGKVVCVDSWVAKDPVDSPAALDAFKEKLRPLYGRTFRDETEFELFCMLPIGEEERRQLFQGLVKANSQSVPQIVK